MKKLIRILGIIDAILLIISGLMYFLLDINLINVFPIMLIILLFCIYFETKWHKV